MTEAQTKERARRAEQAADFIGEELTAIRKDIYKSLESDLTPDEAYKAATLLSALAAIETRLTKAIKEPDYQKSITKQS